MDTVIAACCIATVLYVPAFMLSFDAIVARLDPPRAVMAEPVEQAAEQAAERKLVGLAAEPVLLKQSMFSGSPRPFAREGQVGQVVRFPGHGEIVPFPLLAGLPADMGDMLGELMPKGPQAA